MDLSQVCSPRIWRYCPTSRLIRKGGAFYLLSYPFHALTWLIALLGYGFSRWITEPDLSPALRRAELVEKNADRVGLLDRVLGHSWAQSILHLCPHRYRRLANHCTEQLRDDHHYLPLVI